MCSTHAEMFILPEFLQSQAETREFVRSLAETQQVHTPELKDEIRGQAQGTIRGGATPLNFSAYSICDPKY